MEIQKGEAWRQDDCFMIARDVHGIHSRCIQAGWASQALERLLAWGISSGQPEFHRELRHNTLSLLA